MPRGSKLSDAEFVVVANRLPVDLEKLPDGTERWKRSPGGLVTALAPMLRSREGAWVGWPGVPDVDVEPLVEDGLQLHPVSMTAQEVEDYYEGFSNGTLWPLYHDVIVAPAYHRHWWQAYVTVNQRFAEAAADIAAEGATVWVQDYQLQLLPFPPTELFMQLPWRRRIVEGLLGADLVGFHTPGGARNFRLLAARLTSAEPGPGRNEVTFEGRQVRLGAFPISIDSTALDEMAADPDVRKRANQLRADLGDPERIILGVDRLDYTKGIDVRLRAFEELLQEGKIDDNTVMIQIATPSRERVEHYTKMRNDIEQSVGRINGAHSRVGHPVLHYLHQSMPRDDLVAFFAAADVMLVTPLRDGMNLVAKEYVACRHDNGGVLVLSEFAGAAIELKDAILVNPHDTDGVKNALLTALTMNPSEARRRMRAMRRQVLTHDVDHWARAFLDALGLPPAAEDAG